MPMYERFLDLKAQNVAKGMMDLVSKLDDMRDLSDGEKAAVLFFITKSLYDRNFHGKLSLAEIFGRTGMVQKYCEQHQMPEFTAALRYANEHLKGI